MLNKSLFWGSNVSLFAALYRSCLDLKALLALTLLDISALIASLLHREQKPLSQGRSDKVLEPKRHYCPQNAWRNIPFSIYFFLFAEGIFQLRRAIHWANFSQTFKTSKVFIYLFIWFVEKLG